MPPSPSPTRRSHSPAVVAAAEAALAAHPDDRAAAVRALMAATGLRRTQADALVFRRAATRSAPSHALSDESPAVAEWRARRDAAEREVSPAERLAETFDWLRPVALPAPLPPRARVRASERTLIAGDFHFPHECPRTVSVFLQTVAALRPRRVVLNGDLPDLLAVSRFPKDARRAHSWTLQDEQAAFHAFLHQLETIGAAWGLEILETEANHSGNGTGSRWWRYLSERCPELLRMEGAEAKLSYGAWWHPTWSSVRLVEHVVIGDLVVRHGEIVRQHGAYSARAHSEKWQASVLHSHTHRMGTSHRRVPAIDGLRATEDVVSSYEIGCMCRLDADYAPGANWVNGFAVVTHGADGEAPAVETVVVRSGVAVVGALGARLAA
jgi:hypothetical protein